MAINEAEEIVGYCICSVSHTSAHLISIAVQTEVRRRGVATSLLQRTVEFLRARGVGELWLEVNLKNVEAVNLYLKLGFEKEEVLRKYYSDGSDAIRMRLITLQLPKVIKGGG